MGIKVNDELMLKKDCFIGSKGDIYKIVEVGANFATIMFEKDNKTKLFTFTIDKYFDDYFEVVTKEEDEVQDKDWIEVILDNSEIVTTDAFDTCRVVAAKLPNGYIIVDSFNCIDESDEEYCYDAIMEKIYNKIYELEDYAAMYPSNLAVLNGYYDQDDDFNCDVCASCDVCPYADGCQEF